MADQTGDGKKMLEEDLQFLEQGDFELIEEVIELQEGLGLHTIVRENIWAAENVLPIVNYMGYEDAAQRLVDENHERGIDDIFFGTEGGLFTQSSMSQEYFCREGVTSSIALTQRC
jgi:hypothetical protein